MLVKSVFHHFKLFSLSDKTSSHKQCLLPVKTALEETGEMTGFGSHEIKASGELALPCDEHGLDNELFQNQKRLPQRTARETPFHLLYKLAFIVQLTSRLAPVELRPQ